MKQRLRHQQILNLLDKNQSLRVSELSALLEVSEATIRRDLNWLEQTRQLKRVHGGASLVEAQAVEPTTIARSMEYKAEKQRIGIAAAALIQDGDAIFLGPGTTTMEVARHLCEKNDLTVISNSISVINLLAQEKNISLVSTGGLLRRSELSFLGHITEQALRQLRPQKVFTGARAFSVEDGLTSSYLPEVSTDRTIIESGSEVIIVADHSKLGKVAPAFIAPVTAITKLITDRDADPEVVQQFQAAGVEVILS